MKANTKKCRNPDCQEKIMAEATYPFCSFQCEQEYEAECRGNIPLPEKRFYAAC